MQLPRFTPMDLRSLKRFRFQAIFVAIVWGMVAGIRSTSTDHSVAGIALTTVLWIVCIGFLTASWLAFTEVRRRKGDSA